MMSAESNKALVRRYVEVLNGNNLPTDEFVDPNFIYHNPGQPQVKDLASLREFVAMAYRAFPDQQSTIEDIIAEGDKVAYRYSIHCTHLGDFMGIAATGKRITLTGIVIYRIFEGKIQEEWDYTDGLGLMQQLGVGFQLALATTA